VADEPWGCVAPQVWPLAIQCDCPGFSYPGGDKPANLRFAAKNYISHDLWPHSLRVCRLCLTLAHSVLFLLLALGAIRPGQTFLQEKRHVELGAGISVVCVGRRRSRFWRDRRVIRSNWAGSVCDLPRAVHRQPGDWRNSPATRLAAAKTQHHLNSKGSQL
jgi:hypothetical protein